MDDRGVSHIYIYIYRHIWKNDPSCSQGLARSRSPTISLFFPWANLVIKKQRKVSDTHARTWLGLGAASTKPDKLQVSNRRQSEQNP